MGDFEVLDAEPIQQDRKFSFWRKVEFLGERAVIRSIRIACGGAVLMVALAVLDHARDMLGRRFADLSPLDLGNGLVSAIFGLAVVYLAMYVALGPGKSLFQEEREWRSAMELEEYLQLILARIRENWVPPENAKIPSVLMLDLYQKPDGHVRRIDTRGLSYDSPLKKSLEKAIDQTKPLPRLPYLSRSKEHVAITFHTTNPG